MIDDLWLPAAIRYKIALSDFWDMNPKYMGIYQEEYISEKETELKMLDVSAFYNGIYVRNAIASNFSKKAKYPKEPMSLKEEKRKKLEDMSDSEFYSSFRKVIGEVNKKVKAPD